MAIAASSIGNPVVRRLIEAGIVPPLCTKFELILEVSRAVRVRVERVDPEQSADFAREFVFTEMVTKRKLEIG